MAGLVRNKDLFSDKWVNGLAPSIETGMKATIKIYTSTVTYANFVPTETEVSVYTGKARVEPILAPQNREVPGDDSKVQRVRFQIPVSQIGTALVPRVHRIKVTASPLNTSLTKYVYEYVGDLDSSNPIEKTFLAEVVTDLVQT